MHYVILLKSATFIQICSAWRWRSTSQNMWLKIGFNNWVLCLTNKTHSFVSFYSWCNAMNQITLTASNVIMSYLIFVRMALIFILVALQSKVYAAWLRVRVPLRAWSLRIRCVLCSGLCDGLITCSEESYWAQACVCVCVCVCVSNCVSPRNLHNN
jgi:hypothetical protein